MSNSPAFDLDRVRRYADAIGLRYGWPSDEDRAARPHIVRLPLSRERLGDHRFERMFAAVRACALHIDTGCVIEAVFEDYQRVGYTFAVTTQIEAVRLRLCYDHLMAGRPTGLRAGPR